MGERDHQLRRAEDCRMFSGLKICPRIEDGGSSDEFCGGDGKLTTDLGKTNCDRWACHLLEEKLIKLSKKDILSDMVLDFIHTVDGKKILVVLFTDGGKARRKFFKTDIVFDDSGNTYFPIKDNPLVYHINRRVEKKGMKSLSRIFSVLGKERKWK